MAKKKRKRGPDAARVAIEGDWRDALAKAVRIERPQEGWPEPKKSGDRAPRPRKKA